jgi:hypothetical protein
MPRDDASRAPPALTGSTLLPRHAGAPIGRSVEGLRIVDRFGPGDYDNYQILIDKEIV